MNLTEKELYEMDMEELRALAAARTVKRLLWRALLIKVNRLLKYIDFITPLCRKIDVEIVNYVNGLVDKRVEQLALQEKVEKFAASLE
jgi:hypothetical protein